MFSGLYGLCLESTNIWLSPTFFIEPKQSNIRDTHELSHSQSAWMRQSALNKHQVTWLLRSVCNTIS